MDIKEENEVTVRVMSSNEELLKCLKDNGFEPVRKFSLDDYYFIPNSLDIRSLTPREILSKAVIIRYIINEDGISQLITFKIKNIAENGDIINQKAINCRIYEIDEAKKLFEALGYYQIMNIKENDIVYTKERIRNGCKIYRKQ